MTYLDHRNFLIWLTGEEICAVFLGQSSKPDTWSTTDFICNWGGMLVFNYIGSILQFLHSARVCLTVIIYLQLFCMIVCKW